MKKKSLALLTATALSIFALVGCSNDNNEEQTNTNGGEEEVTISIASWAFGTEQDRNLERVLIEAFEDEYPHINVEIDDSIDPADWNGSLSTAASAGAMPDVFMLSQVPTGLANDWLLPLNEVTEGDVDFTNIPDAVIQAVTYDENVYAIPAAQHFLGYFVNQDLFEEANLNAPEFGMGLDDFNDAVRSITSVNSGVVGLNHPFTILDWYPATANESMGWYTYSDEDGFNINSNEFISGVNLANSFISNDYTYETLTEDQRASFNGEDENEVWFNSGIAFKWDGSYAAGVYGENADFNWDFVGIPGDRVVMTNDFFGLSKSTEHAEEAYLLAKWLSFGEDGFLKRIDIVDNEEGFSLSSMPMTTNDDVLDSYFERVDVPGLRQAYENIDNAVVEPVKTVPGFAQSRWEAPTGISVGEEANANIAALLDAAVRGEINIEDYASQVNQLANEKYEEGLEAINR
ncbi:ABC transporter substrate-binding protein [Alkalihalobacillus sp. 1P02AB]|uniref:ABC transporter substrate-binding protein n=1 Tax=Alkalihalobacillus sp. 1P02AB TaxID=3132260 RepID=UPI0039A4FC38